MLVSQSEQIRCISNCATGCYSIIIEHFEVILLGYNIKPEILAGIKLGGCMGPKSPLQKLDLNVVIIAYAYNYASMKYWHAELI